MNKLSKMALIAVTVIVVSATATMAATAKLSSGPAIDAKITETINGSAAQVGQRILMVVDKDIKLNGKVVISAGAQVIAEITDATSKNYAGIPGKLLVSFKTVKAIDGQDISISGTKERKGEDKMLPAIGLGLVCCPLFFLMQGGEGVIPAGQIITVYTVQNADITI